MNIVITGGSGGVGYHTALHLLKDPAHTVIVISRKESGLNDLKSSCSASAVKQLLTINADITNPTDLSRCRQMIEQKVSWIDVLINNAGVLKNKPFQDLSLEDWLSVYNTNVFGAAGMIREVLGLMERAPVKQEGGGQAFHAHIVNIGSMGGVQGSIKFEGLSAYSSSKAALIGLTECLSVEFLSRRIAVNCLALGSVDTAMFAHAFPGFTASFDQQDIAAFIADFGLRGHRFFNGKTLPVSRSTP